jgi:carboxypeptidase Q
MGFDVEGSKYFDYHHTHADTLDKIDPQELSQCVASMAVTAYVIADMPERLGE